MFSMDYALNVPDFASMFGDMKAVKQYESYIAVGGGVGQLPN